MVCQKCSYSVNAYRKDGSPNLAPMTRHLNACKRNPGAEDGTSVNKQPGNGKRSQKKTTSLADEMERLEGLFKREAIDKKQYDRAINVVLASFGGETPPN